MAATGLPPTCVMPPVLLEHLVLRGTDSQRERALRTLSLDASLRSSRAQSALLRRGRPRAVIAHARAGAQASRTIFDCAGSEDLSAAVVVRAEGAPPTGDAAADEAYDGLGATFDLFHQVYGRDSIDDEGLPLRGFVHFGKSYDNAFWDGRQMVFGDGDGEVFARFTIAVDIIGHELAHGVTDDEAQLVYSQQSGALNESVSDVFGSLVKQWALGQTADEADWLIGQGLLVDHPDMALRSMAAPGTAYDTPELGRDAQPAHMDDYVVTTADDGGVHTNSGIPNKAFHLAATAVGGDAWEVAGRVWYDALRDPALPPTASFATFAQTALRAAERLGHRPGSTVHDAVGDAWSQVGVL
ncbi:MAG: M4 family metallopeptidase [Quadrisphaera sp.]